MSAVYLLRIYVFFLQRMEWKPFVYLKYYFEFRLHWTYTDSYSVRMNVWSGDKYCIQDTLACLCIDCSFRLELVRFRLSRSHIFHLHCIMDNPWMNYKCFEQEMSLNTFENTRLWYAIYLRVKPLERHKPKKGNWIYDWNELYSFCFIVPTLNKQPCIVIMGMNKFWYYLLISVV